MVRNTERHQLIIFIDVNCGLKQNALNFLKLVIDQKSARNCFAMKKTFSITPFKLYAKIGHL